MQETVKDAELKILQERLEAREKQLQQMAQLLADLNVQLSDVRSESTFQKGIISIFSN